MKGQDPRMSMAAEGLPVRGSGKRGIPCPSPARRRQLAQIHSRRGLGSQAGEAGGAETYGIIHMDMVFCSNCFLVRALIMKNKTQHASSPDAGGSGKIKITINIDQDILGILREEAANTGIPYQRLINQLLRKAL